VWDVATLDDVRQRALALPETTERLSRGDMRWDVAGKGFVWERPLRASDLDALKAAGVDVPDGPILGAQVADEGVKRALVADLPDVYFTTPHFDGYAAVLVRLNEIRLEELDELVMDAWLARAPRKLAKQFLG
jgi:hypothetical protein